MSTAPPVWHHVRDLDAGRRFCRETLLFGEMRLLDVDDLHGNRVQFAQEL